MSLMYICYVHSISNRSSSLGSLTDATFVHANLDLTVTKYTAGDGLHLQTQDIPSKTLIKSAVVILNVQ